MKYDVDFFIKKFEAINGKWGEGRLEEKCAFYHCGGYSNSSKESLELSKLFGGEYFVYRVNDGFRSSGYMQPTPKQRILAALYDIKAKQQPVKEIIRYVAVTADIREEVKEMVETN